MTESPAAAVEGVSLGLGGCLNSRRPIGLVRQAIQDQSQVQEIVVVIGGLETDIALNLNVREVTFGVFSLGVFGLPPVARDAVESGRVQPHSPGATTLVRGLQAGARDRRAGDSNGAQTQQPLVTQPALGFIHVPYANPATGDAWGYGLGPDLILAAASRRVIVSFDVATSSPPRLPNLFTLPPNLVERLVHKPFGAFPSSSWPLYGPCAPAYALYVRGRGGLADDKLARIVRETSDLEFVRSMAQRTDLELALAMSGCRAEVVSRHQDELMAWLT